MLFEYMLQRDGMNKTLEDGVKEAGISSVDEAIVGPVGHSPDHIEWTII